MLNYMKLWIMLENKGMKKTDLTKNKIISPATLAKLGKNETVTTDTIEKLCEFLECQPGDIMEYISDKSMEQALEQIDQANKLLFTALKEQGISEDQFKGMMAQLMPQVVKGLYNEENVMNDAYKEIVEKSKKVD